MRDEKGFTLIEMLIAMVVSGFLLMGIVQLLIRQQETFQTQNQVVDVQQNMRSALIRLQYELRMIAHGLDRSDIAASVDFSGNNIGVGGSDQMGFLANLDSASTVLKDDALPWWEVGCAGSDGGCYTFNIGDSVTLPLSEVRGFLDPLAPADEYEVIFRNITTRDERAKGRVTDVNFNDQEITFQVMSGRNLSPGDYVGFSVDITDPIIYLIDSGNLIRRQIFAGDNIIAENIQDFQVEYGFDWNNDNVIDEVGAGGDDDEWVFNVAGDPVPLNTDGLTLIRVRLSFQDTDMNGNLINREIQFTQAVRNLVLSKGMI